jgi:hypothetical protein
MLDSFFAPLLLLLTWTPLQFTDDARTCFLLLLILRRWKEFLSTLDELDFSFYVYLLQSTKTSERAQQAERENFSSFLRFEISLTKIFMILYLPRKAGRGEKGAVVASVMVN